MSKGELEVEVASARFDAAQAKAVRAEREWGRAKELLQRNAISLTEADQKECDHKVAQAELREAAAQVEIAKLALKRKGRGKGR